MENDSYKSKELEEYLLLYCYCLIFFFNFWGIALNRLSMMKECEICKLTAKTSLQRDDRSWVHFNALSGLCCSPQDSKQQSYESKTPNSEVKICNFELYFGTGTFFLSFH